MSIRHRLLAAIAGAAGGALTPVGGDTAANTSNADLEAVWGGTTAAQAGTVTSVSARFDTAGEVIRFFTIRDVSGTWTVRAVTGALSSVVGVSAYPVSLAIQPGDSLGVYTESARADLRKASGAGSYRVRVAAGVPTAGAAYAPDSTDTASYAFVGTGTQ